MIPDRDTLARVARWVLDQLHPVDFDRVRSKFASLDDLAEAKAAIATAMAERAASMLASPPDQGSDVPPEQLAHLLGSTLTFGDQAKGVHVQNKHAWRKFRVMTRWPDVPVAVAVLLQADDSEALVKALAAAYRLDGALAAESPAVPEDDRRMVAAAIAANPRLTPRGTEPLAAAATIFERAGELASYCGAAGLVPEAPAGALGNIRFLLIVAGYARAVTELAGPPLAGDPYGDVRERADRLASALRRAMNNTGNPYYGGPDEPDVLVFYSVAAEAVGGELAAKVFGRLSRVLWWHRLRRDEKTLPVESDVLDRHGDDPEFGSAFERADELARLMAALAVEDTVAASRRVIVAWILGREPQVAADDLYQLLGCLRRVMAGVRDGRVAAPPDDLTVREARKLESVLLSRLTEEAGRDPHRGAVEMAAAVLPELWSRRESAVKALTQKVRADVGPAKAKIPFAKVLAAAVARGPGQVFVPGTIAQHPSDPTRPRCVTATTEGETERCVQRAEGPAPSRDELCPARPWGETGFVDSHQTLADTVPTSCDALRKRLQRYAGVWAPLALPGQP